MMKGSSGSKPRGAAVVKPADSAGSLHRRTSSASSSFTSGSSRTVTTPTSRSLHGGKQAVSAADPPPDGGSSSSSVGASVAFRAHSSGPPASQPDAAGSNRMDAARMGGGGSAVNDGQQQPAPPALCARATDQQQAGSTPNKPTEGDSVAPDKEGMAIAKTVSADPQQAQEDISCSSGLGARVSTSAASASHVLHAACQLLEKLQGYEAPPGISAAAAAAALVQEAALAQQQLTPVDIILTSGRHQDAGLLLPADTVPIILAVALLALSRQGAGTAAAIRPGAALPLVPTWAQQAQRVAKLAATASALLCLWLLSLAVMLFFLMDARLLTVPPPAGGACC